MSLSWSLLGFHAIANLFSLATRVKYSDKQREDAQKLFNEHKAAMNLPDRELAQSLLECCGDFRACLEAKKCLLTRIKPARLYCTQVDKTLQGIQVL
jgi:hypothetical protein